MVEMLFLEFLIFRGGVFQDGASLCSLAVLELAWWIRLATSSKRSACLSSVC